MVTREVLTLQFGHYANFVGTHWWNIQESGFTYNPNDVSEINHDVLFREGLTNKNEVTFTPRLLSVDLKGSLKALPVEGELYNSLDKPSTSNVFWNEKLVEIQQEEPKNKSEFQKDLAEINNLSELAIKDYNFEKDIKVWSDFLYSRLHPKSVNIIKEYEHCNQNTPFDAFPLGSSVWKSPEFEDDFCDKIRNYIEECDRFQGFHLLTDSTNAFSGFSSSCVEYLKDEYERKSVLVFPVIPSHFEDNDYETDEQRHQSLINDSTRVLNLALSYHAYSQHSSLFVPLCTGEKGWRQPGEKRTFYHTDYDKKIPYHSSAILASALDTFTLKHRLKTGEFSLVDLCADLSNNSKKCAAASMCLPFSLNSGAELIDCLDNWEGPLGKSITPNCELGTDKLMQHIVLRGIPEERLKKPSNKAGKQKDLPAYKCNSINEMLSYYYACNSYASATHVTVVQRPLPVKTPYPKIFDKVLGVDGNVMDAEPDYGVYTVPVLAGLHSGSGIGDMLENLHTEARKIKYKKFSAFLAGGLESDDFEECLDGLFELREAYDENYFL